MKVLVLGGTGFIGSAIVPALRARGAAVTVLCRHTASAGKAASLGAEALAGDIREPAAWVARAAGFDAVVHVACTFDAQMGAVDDQVVSALLEAMPAASRLLYTGGVWCWGHAGDRVITESSPVDPVPAFGWGVTHGQRVLAAGGIVVHPGCVVDRATGGVPPLLLHHNQGAADLRAPGGPALRWAVVERHDLAEAYCLALERGQAGEEYLASGAGATMGQLAALAASRLGLPGNIRYEPASYWQGQYGDWAAGYCLDQVVDCEKVRRALGWSPTFRYV